MARDPASANGMVYYCRRYLEPISGGDSDYAVLTGCWFSDADKFAEIIATPKSESLSPDVYADEERFMDRSKIRFFTVVERQSALGDWLRICHARLRPPI